MKGNQRAKYVDHVHNVNETEVFNIVKRFCFWKINVVTVYRTNVSDE